jgi:hypothetical protein
MSGRGWVEIALAHDPARRRAGVKRRRSARYPAAYRVSTETMDPVRDPVSGEFCFLTSDEDTTVDVSRLGLRLRSARAPSVGTRLLLRLHVLGQSRPLEFVGRTMWTRVELVCQGDRRRAVCGVGVELLGGSRGSLDRYEDLLTDLRERTAASVAADEPLG